MAEVLLLHHAQGLTPGVVAIADRLIAEGHVVHTPDVDDGRTFDDLDSGMAYVRDAARELVRQADGELFLYPGDGHLFVDSSLGDDDERATQLFLERTLALLERVDH